MNRNLIGILIIITCLILLIGIVYFIFIHRFEPDSPKPTIETQGQLPNPAGTGASPDAGKKPASIALIDAKTARIKLNSSKKIENFSEDDLKRMALSFAERFGSYSNQAGYNNIEDLKIFMTGKMQAWSDEFIRQASASQAPAAEYYGINTKAISAQANDFDKASGKAEVLVQTQRWETSINKGVNRAYYQDITINFLLEDSAWKVNSAYWKEKK